MLGRTWQSSTLVERVLIPVLSATMRAAWIVPLVNAVLATGFVSPLRMPVPLWLPLATLLLGSSLAHLTAASPAGRVVVGVIGGGVVLAILTLLLPAPEAGAPPWPLYLWEGALELQDLFPAFWLVLVFAAALWIRAISIDWAEESSLRGGFMTGAVVLTLLMIAGADEVGLGLGIADGITEALLVFVVASLTALALADITRTLRQSLRSTGAVPQLGRFWFMVIGLVVVFVLLLAWAAAAIVAPDAVVWLVRWFSPVLSVIGAVIGYVFLAFGYIILRLLEPILRWLQSIMNQEMPEREAPTQEPDLGQQLEELGRAAEEGAGLPDWAQTLIIIAIIAVAVILFALALRRRFVSESDGVVESREVDWSWELMREQLRSRLRPPRRRAASRFLPLADGEDPRTVIRAAYRRMLTLTAERGLEHRREQTPWGYVTTVAATAPELRAPLEGLTRAYVVARYSPTEPNADLVAEALAALSALEQWLYRHELSEGATPPAPPDNGAGTGAAPGQKPPEPR